MTPENCQNCGTALTGEYCHACGQRGDEPRRVVIGLVQDFLVDTLAIDGKLARSIGLLLWRPGRLARRFLDGKRVYYSPPFRLYLFGSVFFFLTLFWLVDFSRFNFDGDDASAARAAITEEVIAEIEAADPARAAQMREKAAAHADVEADADADEADADESDADAKQAKRSSKDDIYVGEKPLKDTTWDEADYSGPAWLEPYVKRIYEAAQRVVDNPRYYIAQLQNDLPRILLLLPVFYALILLSLYFYRRKFFVYDHFVVSLYMHAALYAYLMIALLLSAIPKVGPWLAAIPLFWGWLQPYAVFKQAYGSNWFSAFLKWSISIIIYFTVVILILTFGFTYTLYQS